MKAILTYHSIDDTGSVISVSRETFGRQVRWLASSGVAVVSLAELLDPALTRPAIAITFDDAYTNFATEAWPQLHAHGLPVTLYVPTGFVGRGNDWPALPGAAMPRLPILDWEALARLGEEGVTLGAHTRTHPDLRTLDHRALADEIEGACEDVRRETGRRPSSFAYPYGFWNAAAREIVGRACASAVTTELRPLGAHEDPCALPRLDAYYLQRPGRLETFGRWRFRQYFRARLALRQIRRRLGR